MAQTKMELIMSAFNAFSFDILWQLSVNPWFIYRVQLIEMKYSSKMNLL